jgi:hypothetical protein
MADPLASTSNLVGGMPLTSVDDLSRPVPGSSSSTTAPSAIPAPSAGVNQQTTTAKNVPDSLFGRSAPKETQPAASPAKPASKPTVSFGVTAGSTDAGSLVQGAAQIRVPLTDKDAVFAEGRLRLRMPDTPGKADVRDYQGTIGYDRVLTQSKDFKLTGTVSAFARMDEPLDGGNLSGRVGIKGEFAATFKPEPWLELRASVFGQHEWFFPKGDPVTTLGGDLRLTATEPKTKISGAIGIRSEVPLTDGGVTPTSIYLRASAQVNKNVSVFGEGFYGVIGGGSSLPSSSWTQQDGGFGVFGGVRVSF